MNRLWPATGCKISPPLAGFPPINVFQQGDDILAIIELPGVSRSDLQIQAKENSIRIFGKKAVGYPDETSLP
ncbi:hypothetical protein [Bradyrhizobium shewense]|uniref:hypothetical protein n=1 Tax=Bradyrhizobium shewense TaxID=1761772 RepID=UPI000B837E58|nr:hypothetical protein [Bradyrhizobium shewense]